jgi:phage protein D
MGFMLATQCQVIIQGTDVTSRFDPHLKSLKITRTHGKAADECTIDLADPDGYILLPQERATVLVNINGQQAFKGFVSDVDYKFGKEGRELSLTASSVDHGSKVKEPKLKHKDGGSLQDAASEFGKSAGLTTHVAGSITSVQRDYWLQQNESFMAWGQRIANEVGASWKIIGTDAYMVAISEGISISGKTLQAITATYGDNLLSGSVSPIISRPKFSDVKISYFDRAKGEKVEETVPTGIDDVDTALRTVITAADSNQSKQKAKAHGKHSKREKGSASIVILGDVRAEPEAIVTLAGIRPGIDGEYRIGSVSHDIGRGGFTTNLSLKEPQGKAGIDKR